MVARVGKDALAAVGLNEALMFGLSMMGSGLSAAATAVVSRRIGERSPERASAAVRRLLSLAVWVGLPVGILLAVLSGPLLDLLGATPEVAAIGIPYSRTLLAACPLLLVQFTLFGTFEALGQASRGLRAQIYLVAINLVLCPLLLFGLGPLPGLGLLGAGLASVIARGVGVGYLLWHLLGRDAKLDLRRATKEGVDRLLPLLRITGGAMGQQLPATLCLLLLIRVVAKFGAPAVAAYTLTARLSSMLWLPSWALGQGVAAVVGQSLGAGKPDRAQRVALRTALVNVGYLGIIACVVWVAATPLIAPIARDPEVIAVTARFMRISAISFVPFAVGAVLLGALNGSGETVVPAVVNAICYGVLQLAFAYGLSNWTPLRELGIPLAFTLSQIAAAGAISAVFLRGKWKTARA
jgi:putative MATE family efflux protein